VFAGVSEFPLRVKCATLAGMLCVRLCMVKSKPFPRNNSTMASNEQIVLTRDADATQIPSGIPHRLTAGTKVRLMQALGAVTR